MHSPASITCHTLTFTWRNEGLGISHEVKDTQRAERESESDWDVWPTANLSMDTDCGHPSLCRPWDHRGDQVLPV